MSGGVAVVGRVAGRRVQRFSLVAWSVGLVVIVAIASTTTLRLAEEWNVAQDSPWLYDAPRAAVSSDGGTRWTADGAAYIDLTADGPVEVAMDGQHFTAALALQSGDGTPHVVGFVGNTSPRSIVTSVPGARLWVQTGEAWRLAVRDLDVVETTADLDGTGDADVVYRGDAVAASIVGSSSTTAELLTPATEPEPLLDDADRLRAEWAPAPYVLLRIRSGEADAAWSVRFESTDASDEGGNG